jgi:hypothetical protein
VEQADIERIVELVIERLGVKPTDPAPAKEFYSIKEAAAITSLSPDHIRKAVVGGTLKSSDVGTLAHPLYRISRVNLLQWLAEREFGAKPPSKREAAPPPSRHHKPRKSAV